MAYFSLPDKFMEVFALAINNGIISESNIPKYLGKQIVMNVAMLMAALTTNTWKHVQVSYYIADN
jgi:hypothetical protein